MFLQGAVARDALTLEWSRREARAGSALNHRSVCTFMIGEDHNRTFIVMELLGGMTVESVALLLAPQPISMKGGRLRTVRRRQDGDS